MKNRKMLFTYGLRLAFFLLPFVIGFIGFMTVQGESLLWAIYHSIRLYTLNTDINNLNALIEIARWLAPVAMCTTLIMLAKSLLLKLKNRFRSLNKYSVSVYGDNPDAKRLVCKLGKRGILGDLDNPLPSRYHILITHDDTISAKFYSKFAEELPENSRIYVCLDNISPMSIQQTRITAFSLEENSATDYWSRFPAVPGEKIALIGNGRMLDTMLCKGLLVNIFSQNQHIEYHFFNNDGVFLSNRYMAQTAAEFAGDRLIEHMNNIYKELDILNSMDRVILFMDEEQNLALASKIKELCYKPKIYIYNKNEAAISAFFENSVVCFGNDEIVLSPDSIMHEKLTECAKKINLHYCKKYGGSTWEELSVFLRQSNISVAEFFPVLRKMYDQGASLDELTRLEHIRWCRFHFLNNWKYSSKRDNYLRLHPCLLPFEKLTKEEQQKDKENVLLALSNEIISEVTNG